MSFRLLLSFFILISCDSRAEDSLKYLSEVILSITSTKIQIIYSNDVLDANNIIVQSEIKSVSELKNFLNKKNLDLEEVFDGVFIIKATEKYRGIKQLKPIVIGRILNKNTGLPIKNSMVINLDEKNDYKNKGLNGFFIEGEAGSTIHVKVSADGYASITDVIEFTDQLVVFKEYTLEELPEALENLYVTTSLYDFAKNNNSVKSVLNRDELISTPVAGNDAVRAVNKIPGITSNGISARQHVRGGRQDESQVILNGLSLNNPYHFKDFFGVFSAINLSYVDELSLYAGVFPARFGSYISSVMDIQSTVPKDEFFLDLSLGVLNSHVTFGDTIKDDFQYLMSYRSGGDLFRSGLINVETGDPSYDDLFVYGKQTLSDGTLFSANMLQSKDKINLNLIEEDESARAQYTDNNYWFTFDKILSNNTSVNSLVSYQSSRTNRSGQLNDEEIQGSLFEKRTSNRFGLSAEINNKFSDKSNTSFGLLLQKEETDIDFITALNGTDFISEILHPNQENRSRNHQFKNTGYKAAIYVNIRHQFNAKLYGDFGLRLDYMDWISKIQNSPRLNLSYFFDDSLTFRFGLGRHFQNQNIDGVLLEDATLEYFETESSNIAIFEIQKDLDDRHSIRTEFYYKDYQNVKPYYENLFIDLHLHPELFSDRIRIDPDSAFSKGADITFSGFYENFNWSASYSFSEVKDVVNGSEVLRDWDQQNTVKFNVNWHLNNWQLGTYLHYHTGWPRTLIQQTGETLTVGNRNALRNKDYLNVNLRFSYDQMWWGKEVKYWLQVNNALNRKNQCCSDYDYDELDDGSFELVLDQKDWMPLIPSLGIDISF